MSDEIQELRHRVDELETRLGARPATPDLGHLDMLPLFHYLVAGLTFLLGCFPMIHVAVGLGIVMAEPPAHNPPPPWFGWIFVGIGAAVILMFWAVSVLLIVAGRCIAARKRYILCMAAAVVALLVMPFGTALGIFTLVTLMREPVKRAFGVT